MKYMKWDGVCFANPLMPDRSRWCNQDKLGAPPPAVTAGTGVGPPAATPATGVTLSTPRAEVVLIAVSEVFAPIEEYAIIELEFKNIQGIGCLVLQIRDADDQLVYAERLTKEMVQKLADDRAQVEALHPPLRKEGRPALSEAARQARWEQQWANPVATPYRVTVWVTNKECQDSAKETELTLDVSTETSGSGGTDFVEKHKPKNPGGGPPPAVFVGAEQTSVRLTGDLKILLMKWEEVYEHLTGSRWPDDPTALDFEKKTLWAKCRLNQLGFSAGPIDTSETQEDYLKAIRRYGAMRAVGGVRHYDLERDNQVKAPARDGYAGLEQANLDQLLDHLVKERQLAAGLKVISEADKLGDGGADPLRFYIDANRYFVHSSEGIEDGKSACEKRSLTPPCLPLRPQVKVLGRDKSSSYEIPEVLEPVFFNWSWNDAPEKHERLPDPQMPAADEAATFEYSTPLVADIYRQPEMRSKTRRYVEVAKERVHQWARGERRVGGGRTASFKPVAHNAMIKVGGLVTRNDNDNNRAVFRSYVKNARETNHLMTDRSGAGHEPFTKAKGVATPGGKIYFCPSLIAGDIYALAVELFWEDQRTTSGTALREAGRLDEIKELNQGNFKAATRRLEAWRRLRVAKFVHWPAQTQTWNGKPFNLANVWEAVKKEYEYAYIEFQESALPECRIQEVALNDATHFRDPAARILKSGLKISQKSFSDAFPALFPNIDYQGRTEPASKAFSPDRIFPPLNVIDWSVAGGTLPNLAALVNYVVIPSLELYVKVKTNSLSAEEREKFESAWQLVRDWRQYPATGNALEKELHLAGAAIDTLLSQVITFVPGAPHSTLAWNLTGPTQIDPKALPVAPNSCVRFHAEANPASPDYPKIVFQEPTATFTYTTDQFPELMDLMFLPATPGGARQELIQWVRETSLEAKRAHQLKTLITERAGQALAVNQPHFMTYYALMRYRIFLESILDENSPDRFRNLPRDQRKISWCLTYPNIFERLHHNVVISGAIDGVLGLRWAAHFDEIIRKGLLCETDSSGQYKKFADGMIIINARANEPITIGGQTYDNLPGPSLGLPLGVVLLSQKTSMEPYALLAHEIGHILFMDHYRNAGGLLFDHDHDDANCAMSYPLVDLPEVEALSQLNDYRSYPAKRLAFILNNHIADWPEIVDVLNASKFRTWETKDVRKHRVGLGNYLDNATCANFRPHFCGKCNLKLRGWDIYASRAEAPAPVAVPKGAPVVAATGGAPPPPPPPSGGGAPPPPPPPSGGGAPPPPPPPSGGGAPPPPPPGSGLAAPPPPPGGMPGPPKGAPPPPGKGKGALPTAKGAAPPAAGPSDDPVMDNHPDLLPITSKAKLSPRVIAYRHIPDEIIYPEGEEIVAADGDTVCGIAAIYQHQNCSLVRAHPRNAAFKYRHELKSGERVYVPKLTLGAAAGPKKSYSIRFIRGAGAAEGDLARLHVSNYDPDKTGLNVDQPFPSDDQRGHHAPAYEDEDAFKVEVSDPTVPVNDLEGLTQLSALCPTYSSGGALSGHQEFAGAEAESRSLEVTLTKQPVNGAHHFQSCYLRLVSNTIHKNKRPRQSLLVTDLAEADRAVEILDQNVRATYRLSNCQAMENERCRVSKINEIGRGKKAQIAIRVLREKPNGRVGTLGSPDDNGACGLGLLQKFFDTSVRQLFAQAQLRFEMVKLETVDPPSDMITVSNGTGHRASRDSALDFFLVITTYNPDGTEKSRDLHQLSVDIKAGFDAPATANLIKSKIDALKLPEVASSVMINHVLSAAAPAAQVADLIIKGPLDKRFTFEGLPECDAKLGGTDQLVECVKIDPKKPFIVCNYDSVFQMGSPMFRQLFYYLDTPGDVIDLVYVKEDLQSPEGTAASGFALGAFTGFSASPINYRPHPFVANSGVVTIETAIRPGKRFLAAHELGHILIDIGTHTSDEGGLMFINPGDNKDHLTIIGHAPPTHNWQKFELNPATGTFNFLTTATESLNAADRISRHPYVK